MSDTGADIPLADGAHPSEHLRTGEAAITTFRPSRRAFLYRTLTLSLITGLGFFVVVAGLILWLETTEDLITPLLQATPFVIPLFILLFLFEDWTKWRRHRGERWHLTNLRLIYENADRPEADAHMALGEIEGLRRVLWWHLRLDIHNGQSAVMAYMARPGATRDQITQARAALKPPEDTP